MSFKLSISQVLAAYKEYPIQTKLFKKFPPGRPVFLTGTHRSGTTWVAKMLAPPGIWHLHEPFNPNQGLWKQSFSYLRNDDNSPLADQLLADFLIGKHKHTLCYPGTENRFMPLRIVPQSFNRVLIKDPLACLMTEYLATQVDFHTLILFRHPAGFCESICRLGWPKGYFIRQFLEDKNLMIDWLHPYENLMRRYMTDENSIESAAVLHACLNKVLWGIAQRNPNFKVLIFEELCQNPMVEFKKLYTQLSLPYNDEVRTMHTLLTQGKDTGATNPHAVTRNSTRAMFKWRDSLSQKNCDAIRRVWDTFEIPLYQEKW